MIFSNSSKDIVRNHRFDKSTRIVNFTIENRSDVKFTSDLTLNISTT